MIDAVTRAASIAPPGGNAVPDVIAASATSASFFLSPRYEGRWISIISEGTKLWVRMEVETIGDAGAGGVTINEATESTVDGDGVLNAAPATAAWMIPADTEVHYDLSRLLSWPTPSRQGDGLGIRFYHKADDATAGNRIRIRPSDGPESRR